MLEQFTVKNYKSIKDEATLDLTATSISEHKDSILESEDGQKYLPLSVIYGPNGGGKSNVLEALGKVWTIVIQYTNFFKNNNFKDVDIDVEPYAFSKTNRNQPTEFELLFNTKECEYKYILHIKKSEIVYEYLGYKKFKGRKIFTLLERNENKYKLDYDFKGLKVPDGLSDDVSLLSLLGGLYSNNSKVADVINWFNEKLIVFSSDKTRFEDSINTTDFSAFNQIVLNMFQEMDINIDDIKAEKKEDGKFKYKTKHIVNDVENWLDLEDESSGTIKLFSVSPLIAYTLSKGATLVIDELDSKLHPLLIGYIIDLFRDKKVNKHNAQLIFTSHDLTTMDSKYFRRDEIWFVAKGKDQNAILYSLVEFKDENGNSIRKDAIYSKQYIEGKYGADPYLKRIKE